LLLNKAGASFNWSEISPTIFGAVFESTLNPETRRSGVMHYTSLENIHKVIEPLFLDGLKKEFETICNIAVEKTKMLKLREFQTKLASLTFFEIITSRLIQINFSFLPESKKGANLGKGCKIKRYKKSPAMAA